MQRTAEHAEIQTRAIAANERHVRLADSRDGWALFYGTLIRKQHCESYIRSFERLLLSAAGCDPEGMIVDALHGNAQGRLYRVMCTLRNSPPAGVSAAG